MGDPEVKEGDYYALQMKGWIKPPEDSLTPLHNTEFRQALHPPHKAKHIIRPERVAINWVHHPAVCFATPEHLGDRDEPDSGERYSKRGNGRKCIRVLHDAPLSDAGEYLDPGP